ncbi:methyltransferase domain-containing protein [Candidatus Micrarchaeota archaeon]|nr:methyltransferase domain-containing protein [Candidatus Micrarchaeota archaeon]MBD3417622.1 methyltransferase domain-containing protein [Candidatus Micrarchaeota archaeon]
MGAEKLQIHKKFQSNKFFSMHSSGMARKKGQGVDVRFPQLLKGMKRGPAVIIPKDIGMVISYTGIGKKSKVVEAGAGSGFATIVLGNIAKSVVSYERNADFCELAKNNAAKAGLKNVKIKKTDVLEKGIKEKNVDLVLLDMPESQKAVGGAHKALAKDGYLVGFLPNMEQAKEFYFASEAEGFSDIFMLESIVREYDVRVYGVRPKHVGLTHTAYLVFARK